MHKWNYLPKPGSRPTVLIDIDGCVLKWQANLPFFLAERGIATKVATDMILDNEFKDHGKLFGLARPRSLDMVLDFHRSHYFRSLPAYDDALRFINDYKADWDFVAVTACGDDPIIVQNRMFNLNALFPGAFIDIFTCGPTDSKSEMLSKAHGKYHNTIMFIDDMKHNIEDSFNAFMFHHNIPRYWLNRNGVSNPRPNAPHIEVDSLLEAGHITCHEMIMNAKD